MGRRGGDVVFLAEFGGDRLAQSRFPGGWSVAGLAPIQGFDGSSTDEIRGVEIRFARTQAADIGPIGAQLFGLGSDGQG